MKTSLDSSMPEAAVTAPAPAQRARSKPLLPILGVCTLLDCDQDDVLKLIREGRIAWCWDVAVNIKRGHKHYLRFLPASVADYLRGCPCSLKWPEIFNLLLPDTPTVTSVDLYHMLNVSGDHLYNLVKAKQIVPCSSWRRGPLGKAHFAPARVIEFLQKRRFP
jgi:hypothetical protein